MSNFWGEFRKFIMRGNMIDLAVGIVIGGAFSTIVSSLVNDIIMPPIGLLFGDTDFSDLFVVLRQGSEPLGDSATLQAAQEVGAVTLNYGLFINHVITFLIVGLAIFIIIRGINRMRERFEKEEEKPAPTEKACQFCTQNIPINASRCPYCTSHLEEVTS